MGALESIVTAQFTAPGLAPNTALARWRSEPPAWLSSGYKEIADSYNSVTWERRHTPLSMALVGGFLFGGRTVYRLTALFAENGAGGARVTVNGTADPKTRDAIKAEAETYVEGGIV